MQVAIAGDFHIGVVPRHAKHAEDIRNSLSFVVDKCTEHKVDHFINLGDLFHTSSRVSNENLHFVKETFDRLVDGGVTVWNLLGNHDYAEYDLVSLFANEDVHVVTRDNYPVMVEDKICLYPYLLKDDPVISPPHHCQIACIHQAVVGSVPGNWDRLGRERIFTYDEISRIGATHIFSGHLHQANSIRVGDAVVIYPGSASVVNFTDARQDHYLNIVKIDNEVYLRQIEIPQRKWIEVDGIPSELEPGAVYKIRTTDDELDLNELRERFTNAGAYLTDVIVERDLSFTPRIREVKGLSYSDQLKNWFDTTDNEWTSGVECEHNKIMNRLEAL